MSKLQSILMFICLIHATQALTEIDILSIPDSVNFGTSVSVSGNFAIVGSPGRSARSSSVYAFQFDGTYWVEHSELIASNLKRNSKFGTSVSVSGNFAIIGSPGLSARSSSVYAFQFNGTSWVEHSKLIASNLRHNSKFGTSVSMIGNVAIVGSTSHNHLNSAHIFEFNGTLWNEIETLTSRKDYSVAIENNNVIIGVPPNVHIYEFDDDIIPDPQCSTGITDSGSQGTACCSQTCGMCGGQGCGSRPGGSDNCCYNNVINSNRYCNEVAPPCILP